MRSEDFSKKILINIKVPTGNIMIVEGNKGNLNVCQIVFDYFGRPKDIPNANTAN